MTKEEAIKVLSESIHDGSKVPWDKMVEAVHLSIEALSHPSLPSNLDEAELKYVEFSDYPPANQEEELMVYNAFKAGAEWIAGQGVTVETIVRRSLTGLPCIEKCLPAMNPFSHNDKVIVQVRKKED